MSKRQWLQLKVNRLKKDSEWLCIKSKGEGFSPLGWCGLTILKDHKVQSNLLMDLVMKTKPLNEFTNFEIEIKVEAQELLIERKKRFPKIRNPYI